MTQQYQEAAEPPVGTLKDTCKMGQGPLCCRYLVMGEHFTCAKLTATAFTIDARVASGSFTAKGDNCPGFAFGTALS